MKSFIGRYKNLENELFQFLRKLQENQERILRRLYEPKSHLKSRKKKILYNLFLILKGFSFYVLCIYFF